LHGVPLARNQFVNCGPVQFILTGTNAAGGFVQGDINELPGPHGFAIHGHLVAVGFDLAAEQTDGRAIDRDPAFQNKPLAGPAGSHTGVGEKFLQANQDNGW